MSFAHEHIQKIKTKEFILIVVVAVVISALLYLNNFFFGDHFVYIISLALIVLGMNFIVYTIRKSGVATLFYLLTALFTFFIAEVGIFGWKKIMVFFIAGVIFELIFLILKIELHNLTLDVIIGTSFSMVSIPLTTAFLLSSGLASSFPLVLINWLVLTFVVGLVAAVITSLIWHEIKQTKPILKLESYLMKLN